jgi:flavin reductase (DIM6/NTAB) family NADH-FMN oxidoreductase RutF
MYFDIERLDQRRSYSLLASTVVPRPIAWVVSCDAEGRPNAAPYSFFNFFNGFPPTLCIGMSLVDGAPKDSLANIRACGEFVVNMVPAALAEPMNTTAVAFARGVDELERAGLRSVPSTKVRPPRIADSPVAIECRLHAVLPVDVTAVIVVAHAVAVHVADEAVLDAERCRIDTARLQLIGRMESPGAYVRTTDRFEMLAPTLEAWTQQHAPEPARPGAPAWRPAGG